MRENKGKWTRGGRAEKVEEMGRMGGKRRRVEEGMDGQEPEGRTILPFTSLKSCIRL